MKWDQTRRTRSTNRGHKRWKTTLYWDEHWGDLSQAEIGENIVCTPQDGDLVEKLTETKQLRLSQRNSRGSVCCDFGKPDACVEKHQAKHHRHRSAVTSLLCVEDELATGKYVARDGRSTPQPRRTTRDATVDRRKTAIKNKTSTRQLI